jgi:quercetin dioxygenase-like cupin family protein
MQAVTYTPAAAGDSYLMLGADVLTTKLAGGDTDGELAIVVGRCAPGQGPAPHVDPWRESFYVVEGALDFDVERDGALERITVAAGDVISVSAGTGHGFRNNGDAPARFVVISRPAGLDAFFADAGEPLTSQDPPPGARQVDRDRLARAFERHGLRRFEPAGSGAGEG